LALIEKKHLNTKKQKENERRWLNKEDVLNLPKLIRNQQEKLVGESEINWDI
jgi:hypothetical protein